MICGSMARSLGSKIRVGQLSMIAGAIAEPSISASDWVAKTTEAFFLRRVFSHSRSWPAIKASFNAVEQIGKDGRRDCRTNQSVGLKDLDGAFAKALEFRINKSAIWPAKAIRLESALQRIRLKKDARTGQSPLLD